MNENNIISALNVYDGTQASLEKTVDVLETELGEDWTSQVFQKLGGLSPELKEKLNHVFNYYASLTAWQEAQSYLGQNEPLDSELMQERLPVLKHWLDFFGDQGQSLYVQLEQKVASENSVNTADNLEEEVQEAEQEENVSDAPVDDTPVQEEIVPEEANNLVPDESLDENIESEVVQEVAETEPYKEDSEEIFTVKKAVKIIQLLDSLQSWLSARCLELDNIEVFAYPYYGLVVDMMRQAVKAITAVEDLGDLSVADGFYEGGLEGLKRKKEAINSDIKVAEENCESETTALIDKNMNLDQVKKTLGNLDESTETEYLGPAPDGFELMEDVAPLDEKAVKEQYQHLEEQVKEKIGEESSVKVENNTSQTPQNGVQRKLSFSLKPKKT